MVELESEPDEKIWKKFLRTHWKMLVLFVGAASLAIAGALLVFLWFVGDAQVTSLVPATVGLWTIGYLVTFLLHLIFWEVLFIGIPVLITVAAIYFLWWKKIPDEERKEYRRRHLFGKRSRRTDGGGAISLLVNIVFIIKVYLDGNWNVPFATWTFDYLVYSYLWALLWILIIFGIPILLGGTWWIRREMKKKP
jgi:drug/metabolite transporter superfamily protein YnfA